MVRIRVRFSVMGRVRVRIRVIRSENPRLILRKKISLLPLGLAQTKKSLAPETSRIQSAGPPLEGVVTLYHVGGVIQQISL